MTRMTLISIAAACLLAGAVFALVLRSNVQRGLASVVSQAAATVCVLWVVIPVLGGAPELHASLNWSYPVETVAAHLDALGAFFLSWSLPMTLLGTIYALGYLRPHFSSRHAGVHFVLLNLTSLSFLTIYTVESAFVFLLGWEIAAVAAWLLVIWDHRNQKVRFAGFNYLVSTHVGLFILVAAFMTISSRTGSMDFQSFAPFLQTPGALRDVTFVLLMLSFALKSAFFPFHTWLPRAHSAAPAHVSALMSGVIHKAGLFGMLRFILLLGKPEPWMGWFLIVLGWLSALVGVLYTTAQRDLKRLLGYSSTENVGIAGVGFGMGCLGLSTDQPALVALGFTGGILHILNHAFFKCLLFYAAGAVYRSAHTVDLERLGGLARRMPWTSGFFLVGGLASSALPPFNGFVSELLLFSGLLGSSADAGMPRVMLVSAASVMAFVGGASALAMTRAYGMTFLGGPRDSSIHTEGEVGLAMRIPMLLHTLGVVVLGVWPASGLLLIGHAVGLFTGGAIPSQVTSALTSISGLGALLLLVFGGLVLLRLALTRGMTARQHVTWACGYTGVTPRMQYTSTSFSLQFGVMFDAVLVRLRRQQLPQEPFPRAQGHLHTHCVDAVERRLFEVMGEGDTLVARTAGQIPESTRVSFAAGLVVIVGLLALLLTGTG